MDDDQQFCLRWNNHQSTLVSVFDTLLENGTLVDCTLAAEGKYLKAHKVVLSACSPYFESLLSQQYDKHPIFILKDVKFQELKAMMDYMYRGEVNISQDQLAALLKAAESLQIKGLSDSRSKSENEPRKSAPPQPVKTPPPAPTIPRVQGLTIEQRKAAKLSSDVVEDSRSREGSASPLPRKRKKPRRRSQDGLDNHDASNSSESHSNQTSMQNIPTSIPAIPLASTSKLSTDVPEPTESKADIIRQKTQSLTPTSESDLPQVPTVREKLETHSELMLEPKSEYMDDDLLNEDSVEDLTLDDDDINNMEGMDHSKPGPSHGSGDGSSQGFSAWHMAGNQTQDEVFLAAQEAVGAHRDTQGLIITPIYENSSENGPPDWNDSCCPVCGRKFASKIAMLRHCHQCSNKSKKTMVKYKEDNFNIEEIRFPCQKCNKSYKNKKHLDRHIKQECIDVLPQYECNLCHTRFRRKYHLVRHRRNKHQILPNVKWVHDS